MIFYRIFLRFCCLFLTIFMSYGLSAEETSSESLEQTKIRADRIEILAQNETHSFHCQGNVVIQSRDLRVQCDELNIMTDEPVSQNSQSSVIGEDIKRENAKNSPLVLVQNDVLGAASKIVATGNVKIVQNEHQATAGCAEIFPKEHRIILSNEPVVTDPQGVIKGYRIILYRDSEGIQRVSVEGDPNVPAERPCIVLPSMTDS